MSARRRTFYRLTPYARCPATWWERLAYAARKLFR